MSVETPNAETQQEQKPSDKEMNFAKVRQQLEQERQARLAAEERAAHLERTREALKRPIEEDDDDEDGDPYVDRRKLNRKLSSFEKQMEEKIERKAEEKARQLLDVEKKESWLRQNSDFYDIMQHAETLASKDPEMAEAILSMPNNFERQKLVYKTIKALGIHKKEEPKSSVQDKIEQNRRSPYYQPSGIGSSPYSSGGDFSSSGQKNAYSKMQELKKRLGG